MSKTIVFTGGGSAGHVTPNIALIHRLKKENWQMSYIGSKNGIEKNLMAKCGVDYYSVATGKLRRYFSWQNFIDPFKIIFGIFKAYYLLLKLRPNLVFSKGGFVAFPVVVASWLRGIPVIVHESDLTPGLANRLSFPFASRVCVTFERAKNLFKKSNKVLVTGTPIRETLFHGDANKAKSLCHFDNDKPCLLVIGGGLGSEIINDILRQALATLLAQFNIIHLCGYNKTDASLSNLANYKQFEYVDEELAHFFALADIVISRSGANSVCEILSLKKPHIFVPLSLKASRGDQIHNAKYFEEQGVSVVIDEEKLNAEHLIATIAELYQEIDNKLKSINSLNFPSGTDNIINLIKKSA